MEGVKDTFRHWWLVIRCSAIGTFTAIIPGMGPAVSQWLAYAQTDLAMAAAGAQLPLVQGWAVAFHCQQAVEKAFKGALLFYNGPIVRTHDLVRLEAVLAGVGLTSPIVPEQLEMLTPFAIDDKYPRLKLEPISRLDAADLIPTAQLAVEWLATLLSA